MGVGKETGLGVSQAPLRCCSAADQLCELGTPLHPHLESGNASVVMSLCPQAWKEGLGTGPGT